MQRKFHLLCWVSTKFSKKLNINVGRKAAPISSALALRSAFYLNGIFVELRIKDNGTYMTFFLTSGVRSIRGHITVTRPLLILMITLLSKHM